VDAGARGELGNALIPALDDLAEADLEDEGLAAVAGRIELLAGVGEGAGVMDGDLVAGLSEEKRAKDGSGGRE
jgi:hypothetical protein